MNQKIANELFNYKDGNIFWKKQAKPYHRITKPIGFIDNLGYAIVKHEGKNYKVHRVIYMMHHGEIPKGMEIDHLNHERADNRVENLRICSHGENMRNKREVKGYTWHKPLSRYRAQIKIEGVVKHIGYYFTESAARLAYLMRKLEWTQKLTH